MGTQTEIVDVASQKVITNAFDNNQTAAGVRCYMTSSQKYSSVHKILQAY